MLTALVRRTILARQIPGGPVANDDKAVPRQPKGAKNAIWSKEARPRRDSPRLYENHWLTRRCRRLGTRSICSVHCAFPGPEQNAPDPAVEPLHSRVRQVDRWFR